ncbi:NAD(P)-dependent alcohol dehydrogenase [Coraliomargarita parva]|uniref:NAD(P)-dependent alcohol dehydrogenase n=1 Tax=Coraliomargarita parva TaxID=3014050 RepID=UPI0022B43CD5|nr:NAD(P)-dependent alcohol dehydrogenase [Coraliomargarita parva]
MKSIARLLLALAALAATHQIMAAGNPVPAKGYALFSSDGSFQPYEFKRHAVGEHDVLIETLYAGICHSDIHHVHEDWGPSHYPLVPGHEIVGRITQVGEGVTKFKVGDYAGVGCMVNSCGECDYCKKGLEQFCEKGAVFTYGSPDKYHGNVITQGGYSNNIVLSEDFAIKVPADAPIEKVAPLFCAGITTYSPLKATKVTKGDKVAVAGFGGLGHMAVQYAIEMGAEVTVFDITEVKRQDALEMGAVKYVNVRTPEELKGLKDSFRVIISTIPANYDPGMYVNMLQMGGELVIVGIPANDERPSIDIGSLVFMSQRKVSGSLIGGIPETQEMLDYSVAQNIYPEVEVIPVDQIDEAYRKVLDGEVKFRYVIDMRTMD